MLQRGRYTQMTFYHINTKYIVVYAINSFAVVSEEIWSIDFIAAKKLIVSAAKDNSSCSAQKILRTFILFRVHKENVLYMCY